MKNLLLSLAFLFLGFVSSAQIIATVQMDEIVEGICNHDEVYGLFDGFDGQVEPKSLLSKVEMQTVFNENLQFLKENPKFKSSGMLGVYINCEGEPLEWSISVKTKSKELDQQILEIALTFKEWKAGTLNGDAVDTRELISYKIKKGKLTIN
ncbi:hypothetical protein [Brumimicrobium mesophilum]|uniref:hypothetical protein n=1 Tax=Brumimicrobium mesophilum TaxID=392717 RepID=UPI000D142E7B|nr:hypothetical protein [Brumimicrobium mesophilum]